MGTQRTAATSGLSSRSGQRPRTKTNGRTAIGGKQRRAGHHVVEAADQVVRVELEPDLLERLAHGGGDEVGFGGVLPATGQRHVARPRIPRPLGAADEQHGVGVGRQDHRHGGPDERIASIVHQGWWTARRSRSRVSLEFSGCACGSRPRSTRLRAAAPGGSDRPACRRTRAEPVSDISRSSFPPWQPGQATLVSDRTSWSNSA